jgi:hypothetical protein
MQFTDFVKAHNWMQVCIDNEVPFTVTYGTVNK